MDRLWHLAAQHVYKEILERIWVWDRKVQLTPEDELLLVKLRIRQIAWHSPTRWVCIHILEHLCVWTRHRHLILKHDLSLSRNWHRQTACT